MKTDLIRRHCEGYNFVGHPLTGQTFRWGRLFSDNPTIAPWPELADISISNYCTQNCEYCYRDSNIYGKVMSLNDYIYVLDALTNKKYGSVFQIALGGGEPLLHPDIINILKTTKEHGVIANYTTNGTHFTKDILQATKKYCGAIAISYDTYREDLSMYSMRDMGLELKRLGIKTNIHYVLSERTIKDAIKILQGKYDEFLYCFNAIIFLTFKPSGRAKKEDCITSYNLLKEFIELITQPISAIKVGFDACFVPLLIRQTSIDRDYLDSCECGFFSVYIDEALNVSPCSFNNKKNYMFNLKEHKFETIWTNKFNDYRNTVKNNCITECDFKPDCRGRCIFYKELFFCEKV